MILYFDDTIVGPRTSLADCLRLMLMAKRELAGADVGCTFLRDSEYFKREEFKCRINHTSLPSDQRALLLSYAFQDIHYPCWRKNRASSAVQPYACAARGPEFRDDTLGEAAERKIINEEFEVMLACVDPAAYESKSSVVVHRGGTGDPSGTLRVVADAVAIRSVLACGRGYYDPDSHSAPRDFQTILVKDHARFRPTKWYESRFDRRIFKEVSTDRLYYVDESHPGRSAHLEVFSASAEHLGEADINSGTVDTSKKDPRKFRCW